MNFLDACKEVRRESGVAGTGPSTVTNQSGILEKIVAWVNQAYIDVCTEQTRWKFMWRRKLVPLVLGKKDYTLTELGIADAREVVSLASMTGTPLVSVEWEKWQTMFDLDTASGVPVRYCQLPSGDISFHPTPDNSLQLRAEYYIRPVELTSNTDTFLVPAEYHRAIVWKALELYAGEQEDAALMNRATKYLDEQMDGLARDYLPKIRT